MGAMLTKEPTHPGGDDPPVSTGLTPRSQQHLVELPEPLGYRIKTRLLGPPLRTERLVHERLGRPTALAVFASDNLSSSAYATEEILRVLVPAIGIAAFSLVVPITISMLIVLAFLILSYRQTIKAYPSAGGAYIVTRDNFGLLPAQVAGVALLTDYILTVAVSVAAGAAALASAFEGLAPPTLPISIMFVIIIAAGNLKGVKESGKVFSVPTYFFIANMAILLTVGGYQLVTGNLIAHPLITEGSVEIGDAGTGLLMGATLFGVLHAFASGGAAVTGVEAISNGVPAFREPAWRNARSTLVVMGSLLGFMFLGLSILASHLHPSVFEAGTPTVISQIGEMIYGDSTLGRILFYGLQAGTMLILVLAANTSFADFPRLASFHAGDNFMPRQLTKRGHRLVFSNGIIALAVAAVILLVITDAQVDRLIPLYAIGVFLSFTLSQAGMARHHIRLKEPNWRVGLFINGMGALLSAVVCLIIAITKFTHGAWAILVLVPVLVLLLVRLNKQYETEAHILEQDAPTAAQAPVRNRHVVLVFIDTLDMAAARAIQYARALTPDDLTVVHFDLDPVATEDLTAAWSRLGFSRLSLEIVDCPDRRVERAAAEIVARQLLDHQTEVSVLLPRLVHDRTADAMARTLAGLPHCNVTIVPFHLDTETIDVPALDDEPGADGNRRAGRTKRHDRKERGAATIDIGDTVLPSDRTPIDQVTFRQRARIAGNVYSVRVQPWAGVATLELLVIDETGALTIAFLGRKHLAGVKPGTTIVAEAMIGEHHGKMAMLNPHYEIINPPSPT
jgi:amino acid transporter